MYAHQSAFLKEVRCDFNKKEADLFNNGQGLPGWHSHCPFNDF
jgi:hypothetical protein